MYKKSRDPLLVCNLTFAIFTLRLKKKSFYSFIFYLVYPAAGLTWWILPLNLRVQIVPSIFSFPKVC